MRTSQTRQLSNMELRLNPVFVGRESWLEHLATGSATRFSTARVQILKGAGGVGKTALALEYAARNSKNYGIIWLVRAAARETLMADLLTLADRLTTVGALEGEPVATLADLRRALKSRPDTLLIFDHASSAAEVAAFVPTGFPGHAIITTRDPTPSAIGETRAMDALEREEAVKLLSGRLDRRGDEGLKEICTALGDFPIALVQAAAFMNETGLAPTEYLREFERHWGALFRINPVANKEVVDPLRMALELCYRRIEGADPLAGELLTVASYFHPHGIGEDLLVAACSYAGRGPLSRLSGNPAAIREHCETLARYSIMEYREGQYFASDLVMTVTRDRLDHEKKVYAAGLALKVAETVFKANERDLASWRAAAPRLPHALDAATHCASLRLFPGRVADLLNRCGEALFRRGLFDASQRIFNWALEQSELAATDSKHPSYWAIRNNQGRVLNKLQDAARAVGEYKSLLAMEEAMYGPKDPRLAETLNNLGSAHAIGGRLDLARQDFTRAYSLCLSARQVDDIKRARILNNLGHTLLWQGELEEAGNLLNSALAVATGEVGDFHPDVACILVNLGELMRQRGDITLARHHTERALKIDTAAFGINHPDVSRDLVYLAQVHLAMGDAPAADRLLARAAAIDERCLPENHPTLQRRRADIDRVKLHRERALLRPGRTSQSAAREEGEIMLRAD